MKSKQVRDSISASRPMFSWVRNTMKIYKSTFEIDMTTKSKMAANNTFSCITRNPSVRFSRNFAQVSDHMQRLSWFTNITHFQNPKWPRSDIQLLMWSYTLVGATKWRVIFFTGLFVTYQLATKFQITITLRLNSLLFGSHTIFRGRVS